jgi:chromosome partitioning protein
LGLDIAVGGILLSGADMEFNQIGRETLLKEQLETVKGNYDYCIIDTPPTLGVLTMNALTASDRAIIPLYCDAYSLQGMKQLSGFIESIQRHYNAGLSVDGLLLTKYNERTIITQVLSDNIKAAAENLKTKVYQTKIRATVAVQESQLAKQDIYTASPEATASTDYRAFVEEFVKG